jgi:hypothetical protein
MKPTYYRPGEEVTIGPYAHDRRYVGQVGVVVQVLQPMFEEHRYAVRVRGVRAIFLEGTLRKRFVSGDWSGCVWQPRRAEG